MTVRFSKKIECVLAPPVPHEDDDVDYCRDAADRKRSEQRYVAPDMGSFQQLLRDFKKGAVARGCRESSPVTVVYGNVGRFPSLVSYYADLFFEDVRIRSPWPWREIESYEDDGVTRCETLVSIEPPFGAVVEKPPHAERMIVFASHLRLEMPPPSTRVRVVAYHEGKGEGIFEMPFPFAGCVERCVLDAETTFVLKPDPFLRRHVAIYDRQDNVCVDLTRCTDAFEAYLSLLNGCCVLEKYGESIRSWTIAISSDVREDLRVELQKCKEIAERKYSKVPCNLNGVNVMVDAYVSKILKVLS